MLIPVVRQNHHNTTEGYRLWGRSLSNRRLAMKRFNPRAWPMNWRRDCGGPADPISWTEMAGSKRKTFYIVCRSDAEPKHLHVHYDFQLANDPRTVTTLRKQRSDMCLARSIFLYTARMATEQISAFSIIIQSSYIESKQLLTIVVVAQTDRPITCRTIALSAAGASRFSSPSLENRTLNSIPNPYLQSPKPAPQISTTLRSLLPIDSRNGSRRLFH